MMRVIGEGFALAALGALAYWLVFESPATEAPVSTTQECEPHMIARACDHNWRHGRG